MSKKTEVSSEKAKGCSSATAFCGSSLTCCLLLSIPSYGCLASKPKLQKVASVLYKVSWPIHY